jgi:hypothetical protein
MKEDTTMQTVNIGTPQSKRQHDITTTAKYQRDKSMLSSSFIICPTETVVCRLLGQVQPRTGYDIHFRL